MSKSPDPPSQEGTAKPEAQVSDHDTHSVDSSSDSGSSRSSSSSRSDGPAAESKSSCTDEPQAPAVVQETLSSASSSGSGSSSSSQSGSESDEERSDDGKVASPSLDASFKSAADFGTPSLKVASQSPPVFATPKASLQPRAKSSSPTKRISVTSGVAQAAVVASPPVIMPGKDLVLEASRTPKSSHVKKATTPPVDGAQLPQPSVQPKLVPVSQPEAVPQQQLASKAPDIEVESTKSVKKRTSSKATSGVASAATVAQPEAKIHRDVKPVEGTKKESRKRIKKKKSASGKQEKCVEARADEAETKKADRKRSRKIKKSSRSSKKPRKAFSSASGDESQSSASDPPGPSNRIAKISDGRRFQKLAMARSKHFGYIKDGSIHQTEVATALKRVRTAKFNIQPTHSYRHYNRVFGTDLPHIRKQLSDICDRYESVLGATAELELSLTHKQDVERTTLIKPDAESPFYPLWQFDNDLARADPSPAYRASRPTKAAIPSVEVATVDFDQISALRTVPARSNVIASHSSAAASPGPSTQPPVPVVEVEKATRVKKRKKHKSASK